MLGGTPTSAIGMGSLPNRMTVEIEAILLVRTLRDSGEVIKPQG